VKHAWSVAKGHAFTLTRPISGIGTEKGKEGKRFGDYNETREKQGEI